MKPCLSNPRLAALPWAALVTSAALLATPVLAATPAPLPRGHVYFQAGFDGTNGLQGWNGAGRVEGGHPTGQALIVESESNRTSPTSLVSVVLPAEAMRGYLVRSSAMIQAEDVGPPPNSWNGIKCMLAIETPDRKLWPQAEVGTGTFDWRRVAFTVRVPTNATKAALVLGLEQVSGKVWFDDVNISVARPPVSREVAARSGSPFKGHALPRLRGAMVSPNIDPAGLRVLGGDWKAAARQTGMDTGFYATRRRGFDEVLPWDFIDIGVRKDYLKNEYHRALEERYTPPCKVGTCRTCGVCK